MGIARPFVRPALVTLAVLALLVPRTIAQDQDPEPDPDEMMQRMGPMMGAMMEGMMTSMLAVVSKPETAQQMATFSKNYFDALVAKGFSRQEAMQIVVATGMPSLPSLN